MNVETTYVPDPPEGMSKEEEKKWREEHKRVYSTEYNFGENLLEMLSIGGAETLIGALNTGELEALKAVLLSPIGFKVFHNARSRLVIAQQGATRGWMEEDISDEEIDKKIAVWDWPEGAPRAKDPVEKAVALMANLSDAELARALEKRGLKIS